MNKNNIMRVKASVQFTTTHRKYWTVTGKAAKIWRQKVTTDVYTE